MDWKNYWNDSSQVRDRDFFRQVGRTLRKVPYSERESQQLVDGLISRLPRVPGGAILDIACGNGMITKRLASHFGRVVGVDYSAPLIDVAKTHFASDNVEYILADALEFTPSTASYDGIVICFALQYFSPAQMRAMLGRLKAGLKPGGQIALAEVPDGDRKWNFYRGFRGRCRYFFDQLRGRPIIGHWWKPSELHKIVSEAGMLLSIEYQATDCPNHYFRYDAVLKLPAAKQ